MSSAVPSMLYTQGFGSRPENVEIPFYSLVAPASTNFNFPLGKRWITPSSEYVLTSFSSSSGGLSANWTLLANVGVQIASSGVTAAMITGTVTVTNATATPSSVIIYSAQNIGGTPGYVGVTTQNNGSFVLSSTSSSDTSNFYYLIINP